MNYLTQLRLILILVLAIGNLHSALANGWASHKIVDQHAGLSSNKVLSIAKDKFGFYWIGTPRGLDFVVNGRVGNYNSENFANKEIKFIYTDSMEQLWVATDSDLWLFDYATHTFSVVSSSASYTSANAVCSTERGVVICRNNSIELYSHESSSLETLPLQGAENLQFNTMVAIDGENVLLVASQGRELYRLNITTCELDLYEGINLPQRTNIYRDRVFLDSRGSLWISTYNHSLASYSLVGEGALKAEFSMAKGNLSHDLVLHLSEYDDEILVCTDGGGINSIDLDSYESRRSTKLFDYRELPFTHSVYTLLADKDDGLFIGTIRSGVINFTHTHIQPFNLGALHSRRVNERAFSISTLAFCEDAVGNIWIATDGSGVWCHTPSTQNTEQIESTKELKITAVCDVDSDNLLIAVYGRGVYRLNKESGEMSRVLIVDKQNDKSIVDKDIVVTFTQPYNNSVMIVADKIYQLNLRGEDAVATEVVDNVKFTSGNLFASHQNASAQYVNNQYSVYQIDAENGRCWSLYNSASGGISSARKIDDKLWVVRNNSLYSYDFDGQKETLQLPHMSGQILSIEMDIRGNLWATTFNNLVAVDVENPTNFITFNSSKGFSSDEYLPRAVLRSRSGDIYMGGNSGFIAISRDIKLKADALRSIKLLTVKVDDEVVSPQEHNHLPRVKVPWDYNSIDIEVYIEGRNIDYNNQFKYTIESRDKSSTFISDNRLTLQMPPQGNHIISASYLNNDGRWVSLTTIMEVVITPPWWNSWTFKCIIIVLGFGILILILTLYNHNKGRKLQQIHLEREQELSNNKIQFLINISHELRTPLTLIYAPLKRLLDGGQVQGTTKSSLVKVFAQSRYMAELINMVLDARRMESGYGEIEIRAHSFNEWVGSIVEEFRDECKESNIEISMRLDARITTLNYDAPKCRTVLSNLLMNAIRYSRKDGSAKIIVTTELLNRNVRLSVCDNGEGLEGVDIDRLFNRFIRVNNQTTGSGIGLSYSKAIVERHRGGVIGAYSNELRGATFFFELPLALKCQTEQFEARSYLSSMVEPEVSDYEMTEEDFEISKYTILVVDDQTELLSFLVESISHAFKKVYTATNGAEALQSIKTNRPSIVVSDVMMPQMDGYELCSSVKNDIEISHTPIILLTAKADAQSKMYGYKQGADAYISKPFDVQHLLSLVGSQLRSREIARRYYAENSSPISAENATYSSVDEQFMLKLNAFIEDNLSGTIDVEIIAKHMCMSRAALYKKLKSIIDIGAMEYVTKIRMRAAAQQLISSMRPIAEIAVDCGYNDNQYFSKAFKQFFGVSPSQYRKDGGVRG